MTFPCAGDGSLTVKPRPGRAHTQRFVCHGAAGRAAITLARRDARALRSARDPRTRLVVRSAGAPPRTYRSRVSVGAPPAVAKVSNWAGGSLTCPGDTMTARLNPPNWASNPTRWFAQKLWLQIYSTKYRRWFWWGTNGENSSDWIGPWRASSVGVVELIRTSSGAVTEFVPYGWSVGFPYGHGSYVRGLVQISWWDSATGRWGPVHSDYVNTYGVQSADAPGYCYFI